jgi:hypothetical protein
MESHDTVCRERANPRNGGAFAGAPRRLRLALCRAISSIDLLLLQPGYPSKMIKSLPRICRSGDRFYDRTIERMVDKRRPHAPAACKPGAPVGCDRHRLVSTQGRVK